MKMKVLKVRYLESKKVLQNKCRLTRTDKCRLTRKFLLYTYDYLYFILFSFQISAVI